MKSSETSKKTLMGWVFGSDDTAYKVLEKLGLVPLLTRYLEFLNRLLTRGRK